MSDQAPFRRPPTETIAATLGRGKDGRWTLMVAGRLVGQREWDRFTMDDLNTADALEAFIVEVQHRLL